MDNNQEKKYVNPTADIVIFQEEDVICGSPASTINDENEIP